MQVVHTRTYNGICRTCILTSLTRVANGGGKDPAVYQIRALSFDGKTDVAVYANVQIFADHTKTKPSPWPCIHVYMSHDSTIPLLLCMQVLYEYANFGMALDAVGLDLKHRDFYVTMHIGNTSV